MTATKIGNGTFCHPKTVIGSNVHSDVKTGGAMAPLPLFRILADQLTPFQQGGEGHIMPTSLLNPPPPHSIFRPP